LACCRKGNRLDIAPVHLEPTKSLARSHVPEKDLLIEHHGQGPAIGSKGDRAGPTIFLPGKLAEFLARDYVPQADVCRSIHGQDLAIRGKSNRRTADHVFVEPLMLEQFACGHLPDVETLFRTIGRDQELAVRGEGHGCPTALKPAEFVTGHRVPHGDMIAAAYGQSLS